MKIAPFVVTTGAESEQSVGAPFYQWVGCRDTQDSFAFLVLGVGRLNVLNVMVCFS